MEGEDKPAGAMVSFPRPKGAKFRKGIKIKIKVLRWILILLKFLLGLRRNLGDGEVLLDAYEMQNTYLENGALMWRGRRYIQVRAEMVQDVAQASWDQAARVCVHYVYACAQP